MTRFAYVIVAAAFVAAGAHGAEPAAGLVMSVTGNVRAITSSGAARALERGAEVHQGETISTAAGALVQVKMVDGGYLSVRAGTDITLEKYRVDEKEPQKSGVLLSLLKGGFRSITGLIGRARPDSYQIKTPTATIGVRGTDHEPMFIPSAGAAAGDIPGVYDKVNDGETFIRNPKGIIALKAGQVGFSPLKPNVAPQVLQKLPSFYKEDVKIDQRDAATPAGERKSAADGTADTPSKSTTGKALLLAPSLRTRVESKDGAVVAPTTTIAPTLTTIDPTKSLSTTTSTTSTLSTTTLSPSTSTLSTTTLSPTTSTLSTTTTLSPTTSTLSTTTLSPTTSTLSTTTLSPTTSTLSTTTLSPTTSTLSTTTSSTLTSPTLTTSPLIKR